MSNYISQGFGQMPFIVSQSEFHKRTNQIIDQREYNYSGIVQTSEAQENNLVKRSAPPRSFAKQQETNITPQGNMQQITPEIQQSQQNQNNFQVQSQFQSAILPVAAQSNIGFNNNNNQVSGLQNQPVSSSFYPGQKPANNNLQSGSGMIQDFQPGSSQQLTFQQRDINLQHRPQSSSSNVNMQKFGMSQQIDYNAAATDRQQNIVNAQNNSHIMANQIVPQQKSALEGTQTLRNNSQYQGRDLLLPEQQASRVPAVPAEQNRNKGLQFDQIDNNLFHGDYQSSNNQLPITHQQQYNAAPFSANEQNNAIGFQQNEFDLYTRFFEVCGHQLDSYIGDEQALQVLNTSMVQFDPEVLQQLKEQLNNQEQYSVREFIEVYIKAQNILVERQVQEENMIQAAKDKLNELIQLQEQARISEQTNPNQQSTLYVEIQQAKGLDRQSNYIVRLQFDYNQQTDTATSTYSADPQFNEEFKLKIKNPNSVLTFSVIDHATNRIVGYVTQKLKQFYHQKRIDEWYILEDQGGALGDISRQICIGILWIHSERQYYENILRENDYFEPVIKDQEEKLNSTIELLRILRHPFERDFEAFKQEIEDQQQEKKKRSKKQSRPNAQGGVDEEERGCWATCMGLFDDDDQPKNVAATPVHKEVVVQGAFEQPQLQQQQQPQVRQSHSKSDLDQMTEFKNILVYIYVVVAAITSFFKPNYVDICMALVLVSNYFPLNPQNINKFCYALIFTLFLDILWMSVFTSSWFSYTPSSGLKMILFIIVQIINMIIKVIICVAFQKIKSDQTPALPQSQLQGTQHQNNAQVHGHQYQELY